MTDVPLVPTWLTGTWTRSYIRRADPNSGKLGEPDSTVEVKYVQTPWAFVDVRRPPTIIEGSKEKPMAFGGVTTVSVGNDDSSISQLPPLVYWHSCLEMDSSDIDCLKRWSEADAAKPRATEDQGYFQNVSKEIGVPHAFRESDPDKTLEELWIRIDDGNNQFLGARNGKALLVVAGQHFGYADQDKNVVVSGILSSTKGLEIMMSASEKSLEGTTLSLDKDGWTILPGSTIEIEKVLL